MTISANDVKMLRERTGAGMMDCKKALAETQGNFDEALEYLKKAGLAKAAKKSSRVAAEGLIFNKVSANRAILAELNCETDFVTKNEDFVNFGAKLVDAIYNSKAQNLEDCLNLAFEGTTVAETIKSLVAVIGENITLRRVEILTPSAGNRLGGYSHMGGKIVAAVEASGQLSDDVLRDIGMQIAAMAPQYVDKSQVPQDILNKEKEIFRAQMQETGKPANVVEQILGGKVDKFAAEMSLLQQAFVKDSKKTIAAYVKESDPNAKIVRFARLAVGEGVEKKEENFAAEVAKMTGS